MAKPKTSCEMLERIGIELELLWAQLDTYQELYLIEQSKRQTLLNTTAPGFFVIVQMSLIEGMFMRIFRLMDEASMSGNANCSFESLRRSLTRMSPAKPRNARTFRLRLCLRQLRRDWRLSGSAYSALKKIRNKVLAHNDYTHHAQRGQGQLWMALTAEEFELARQLAVRFWEIYRQAKLVISGAKNVNEPKPERLADRPYMLLKHLCNSLFLDQLLGDECYQYAGAKQEFWLQHIGIDRIRPVFKGE